jgi:hypothetical protein
MPGKGEKGRYNYGRKWMHNGRAVAYRYVNKDKRTKTLVDFKTKKPIKTGPGSEYRRYKK